MSLRIKSSNSKKYKNFEDIDDILNDTAEEQFADTSFDAIPEEPTDEPSLENEPEFVPVYTVKKSVKLKARGKRTINIRELDPNLIPPTLEEYKDPSHSGSKIAIIGKPGCFAKGTKIRMFDGTVKNVEDIQVSDKVMGNDSTLRNVLELCRGFETMYKVCYNKESVIVNENHELSLKSSGTSKYNKGVVLDIKVKDFLKLEKQDKFRWYKSKVDYDSQKADNPYENGCNLKFLGKIPVEFKINDRSTRLSFLAGVIDTYGYLNNIWYKINLSNTLAEEVIELSQSLGFVTCRNGKGFHIYGKKLHEIPVLKYKLKPRRSPKDVLCMKFTLEKLPEDYYYGFTLDGNHKFLLADFSVTNNTGKSTLIKSLLFEKSEIFPCAQVYSGTEDSNHAYSEFIPSTFIFNKFSQSSYIEFIKRQKLSRSYLDNPWAVVIWDDITEDERIFNLPIVKGTYKNGRHWKMLHILSLQYAMDIKPVIRTNIDGTFILRETIKRNRKILFENYSSVFNDFGDFCEVLDQVTNDYTSLYIHNRTQSNNFEDCVFWYKSRDDIPKDFKFGCPESWMFHEERYNKSYVDPIEV